MAEFYKAQLNEVRMTPRKARLIVDMVRGKLVSEALDHLRLTNKRAAPVISKLISSAMANAQDRATVDIDRLYISEIQVGHGVTWKRFIPRAQGRASGIKKRTSRITVKLQER
jgi:large subunit ribosomal protein L22